MKILTYRFIKRIATAALIVLLIYYFGFAFPFRGVPFNKQRHGNPPLTPAWALECWLWEDDNNTRERVDTLLAGYAKYDIPVRTIMLDSPWSNRYNDFEIDTSRYPDPERWFAKLQDQGYRVVLWMTSMVNSYSEDTYQKESADWFNDAAKKAYLACKGKEVEWWKGKGGFIDYTNPDAMKWWHKMQGKVFSYGIDGWKLDGTGTLFRTMTGPVPFFYGSASGGLMTTRRYMDHYYRDEYAYGLSVNSEFVTLSRAIDSWYHPEGFAPVDAAPVTWVGDQKHTWESGVENSGNDEKDIAMKGIDGIEKAMKNILKSAETGYCIIGSDVAGFSGKEIPPRLYIRWSQFSAFCGLFLNGGHGERALWKRTPEELEIIRKFSWLHTELIPYIYSQMVEAHNGGKNLQRPFKNDYQYFFGNDFLVAPIYRDQQNRTISFPKGQWRYFFNDTEVIDGPARIERLFPLDEYPVFIKEGAVIPMNIKRDYTGLGDRDSEGFLTILVYPHKESKFTVHQPDSKDSTRIIVRESDQITEISLSGRKIPHILRIHMDTKPREVRLDNGILTESSAWTWSESKKKLVIRTQAYSDGDYVIFK